MLSRDRSGLDKQSPTAQRWRLLKDAGIELTVLIPSHTVVFWTEPGIHVEGCGGDNVFMRFLAVLKKGKSLKTDLITAQDPLELGWIALYLARYHKKPFEIQDHGGFFDGGSIIEPFWFLRSLGLMPLARRATVIRTVSPHSAERLKKKGIVHVRLAPIPADHRFSLLERHPEPGLVVAVGRLVQVKRYDRLLRAFAECVKRGSAQRLAILGEGPERASLEALATTLGITDRISFEGQGDPAEYLARASVFALFSEHEGWGVAWIEAALAGVPVVMTDTGCAPWLKAQGCAVISEYPELDSDAIECALTLPLQKLNPALVPTIADSAKAQVASWREYAKPRLLVLMQAVDLDDQLVGYFVEWLAMAAKTFSNIHVLTLRVGRYALPDNVQVTPLRPKTSKSKLYALFTLYCVSWRERYRYEGVFLRGDAIYAVVAGLFWRALGKKVVLWYAHYKPNKFLPVAERFASVVSSSVQEAYPGRSHYPIKLLGQGLDENRFFQIKKTATSKLRLLVLGRVQRIKGVKSIIEEFIREGSYGGKAVLTIVGPVLDEIYEKEIDQLVLSHKDIRWIKGLPYDQVPALLAEHDVLVNAYPASLDKVIVESMMSGMIPVVATKGLIPTLPQEWRWMVAENAEARISAIRKIISFDFDERNRYAERVRMLAIRDHSMSGQIKKIASLFTYEKPTR